MHGEPFGRDEMQLAAARAKHRRIGAFLNEGMSEQKSVTFGQHQRMINKPVANVVRHADHLSEKWQLETLANNRGRLDGLPVMRCKPICAGEYQALDRSRNGILAALLGVAQKLLEKQRIAARAVDARQCEGLRRVEEAAREAERLLRTQRAEIHGRERHAASACTPCGVERIALNARRHY